MAPGDDAIRRVLEAAPRRWACQTCGKSFGHRPKRLTHNGAPGSHLAGQKCNGATSVFVLLPEAFVRNLVSGAS